MVKSLTLAGLISLLFFYACALRKSDSGKDDLEVRFRKGEKYLEKRKYFRAQEEFKDVLLKGGHKEIAEDAQFYLAEAYFLNKEYEQAIAEYDRFIRQWSYRSHFEKAHYRICQSYLALSPKYYHDQEATHKSLEKLQDFIEEFPNSPFRQEANQSIKTLRSKLARKLYESAVLYMKMEQWDSAVIYLDDVMETYYDTEWADKARITMIEVYLRSGNKQKAKDFFLKNKDKFVNQQIRSKAESLMDTSLKTPPSLSDL